MTDFAAPPPPAPYPGPMAPPKATSTKGPRVMLIIGIVGLVVAIIGAVLAVIGGMGVAKIATTSATLTSTTLQNYPAFTTSPLAANTSYDICTGFPLTTDDVVVVRDDGADGVTYPVQQATNSTQLTLGSVTCQPRFTFETKEAGSYSVVFAAVPSSSTNVAVVEHSALSGLVGNAVMLSLGIVLAVMAGIVGLGLTIGGALWLRSRKRNARQAGAPPAMGPPMTAPPATQPPTTPPPGTLPTMTPPPTTQPPTQQPPTGQPPTTPPAVS